MFSDDDPGLAELRAIALSFPEAAEKVSHGRPGFFAGKMFAMYGASTKESGPMAVVDWNEVRELVDASFRLVAPRRLVAALDAV
jgi:hypothetical protein